jgi:hypothetical protein
MTTDRDEYAKALKGKRRLKEQVINPHRDFASVSLARERIEVRVEANWSNYFGEACSVAWYSGFLW